MEALTVISLSYIGMTIELYSTTFQTATIKLHVLLSTNPHLSITRSHIQISGSYIIQDLYIIAIILYAVITNKTQSVLTLGLGRK